MAACFDGAKTSKQVNEAQ
ncbi:hypothetical protein GQ600_5221 [Phytophthora cactorum]|nr:hypothetical protein GQ600_5221 [Phytophthora cactorum]